MNTPAARPGLTYRFYVRRHAPGQWSAQVREFDGTRLTAGITTVLLTQPAAVAALPELQNDLQTRLQHQPTGHGQVPGWREVA